MSYFSLGGWEISKWSTADFKGEISHRSPVQNKEQVELFCLKMKQWYKTQIP